MAVIDSRTWLERLGIDSCWALLGSLPVGRVGVLADSAPEIYPVNFALDDRTIVFRVDPGTKLRGLERSPAVCFEVDAIDPSSRSGWSVLVKGRAHQVTDPGELRRLAALPLDIWSVGAKSRWIGIRPVEVSGRRLHGQG